MLWEDEKACEGLTIRRKKMWKAYHLKKKNKWEASPFVLILKIEQHFVEDLSI